MTRTPPISRHFDPRLSVGFGVEAIIFLQPLLDLFIARANFREGTGLANFEMAKEGPDLPCHVCLDEDGVELGVEVFQARGLLIGGDDKERHLDWGLGLDLHGPAYGAEARLRASLGRLGVASSKKIAEEGSEVRRRAMHGFARITSPEDGRQR
jgi:hypothetical protein